MSERDSSGLDLWDPFPSGGTYNTLLTIKFSVSGLSPWKILVVVIIKWDPEVGIKNIHVPLGWMAACNPRKCPRRPCSETAKRNVLSCTGTARHTSISSQI
jgi:hypothetical protein